MLLVEVEAPVFSQVYDFKIERKEKAGKVLSDIVTKICQKEGCNLGGEEENVLLWDREQERILPRDWTIEECGIKTGTRLLLL